MVNARYGSTLCASLLMALPGHAAVAQEVDERHPLVPDGELVVEVHGHTVDIGVWDENELHVTGTVDPELQRFELVGDPEVLRARVIRTDVTRAPAPASLEIRVPEGARLDVSTTGGAVRIEGVTGDVRVSTVGGAVRMVGAPVAASVSSRSGDIELSGAFPRLEVRSRSGDVNVRGNHGWLAAETRSGALRLRGEGRHAHVRAASMAGAVDFAGELTPDASVTLESHAGPVFLRVPPDTPGVYRIRSVGGDLRNLLTDHEPRSPRFDLSWSLDFTLGDGEARIRAASFGWSVTLEPLN